MKRSHTPGYVTAFSSAAALGLTGICISFLSSAYRLDPLVLAFWRNAFVAGALLPFLELHYPKLVEVSFTELRRFFGYGLLLALFNYLWTVSVSLNGAAVATFLVYSSVPFTPTLARLLGQEPAPAGMFPAVVCAITGCSLITGAWTGHGESLALQGIIVGLGSGICFAVFSVAGRCMIKRGSHPWTTMLYSFLCAALILFLSLMARDLLSDEETGSAAASLFSLGTETMGWALLVFLAVGPTLIGYGLYIVSLGLLPSSTVNLIATLEPLFTMVLAFLLLHEKLSPGQLFGAMFILLAVLIVRFPGNAYRFRVVHGHDGSDHNPTIIRP